MARYKDLTGQRFGRLVVVGRARTSRGRNGWLCRCDCGKETVAESHALTSGNNRSCGCLFLEMLRERSTVHGHAARGNGKRRPRLYGIWHRMRQRCNDPNTGDYAGYGGRGIRVCPEWGDYTVFRDWAMANGYRDDLTIERKDVNGNYEPGNCEWIPATFQARNTRRNHQITFGGKTRSLVQWSEVLGIESSLLRYRLKNWSVERAFTAPVRRVKCEIVNA